MEEEGKKWYQRDWDGWLFVFSMQLFLSVFALVASFFSPIVVVQSVLGLCIFIAVVTLKFYFQASHTLMALLAQLTRIMNVTAAPPEPPTRSGRDLN